VRNAAASPRSPAGESEARIVPKEVLNDLEGRADGLSRREVEILLQAARGMSNQQIAASLHLSEATVKRHLANTYSKMGSVPAQRRRGRRWRMAGSPPSNSPGVTRTTRGTGMTHNADEAARQRASGTGVFGISEASCRALLANVADVVTVSDRDRRIIYASPPRGTSPVTRRKSS
jgi:hypothetical protein